MVCLLTEKGQLRSSIGLFRPFSENDIEEHIFKLMPTCTESDTLSVPGQGVNGGPFQVGDRSFGLSILLDKWLVALVTEPRKALGDVA